MRRVAVWLNRPAKRVTVAVLFLLVCVLLGAGAFFQRSNSAALCAYRSDLQRRIDSGTTFLKSHPHGILGIPASTLKVSVANEQSALNSLSSLVC